MNKKRAFPAGVFAPIVTPFAGQKIQYDDLISNIEKYNLTKLKGYMPLGSNGEFQGLTEDESLKLLALVMKYKSKDKTVAAGCGRESAYATVEFIKKTADMGLDYAFVLTPHYFLSFMSDEAVEKYFFYIAENSPVPVVIYNAPKFSSGYVIKPELLSRLSENPNIAAMKNSSEHPNRDYIKAVPASFSIIAGNIKTFYDGLRAGAVGGVLSTASYLPECCCELYEHTTNGDYNKAEAISNSLKRISADTVGPLGVAGVKLAMSLRGFKSGELRLPLLPPSPDQQERIKKYFSNEALIKEYF